MANNSQNKMDADAAKAAQLIKSTAETTATALNIQYIQKDIVEIKDSVKTLVAASDGKIEMLESKIEQLNKDMGEKIDRLNKTAYMGIGIAMTIAVVFPILIKFLTK